MKNSIAENVEFCFTGGFITQLSALVDETEPGIERALGRAVPLVLNELANRIGHGLTPDGLLGLVFEAEHTDVLRQLADPAQTNWHEQAAGLLPNLLGDRYRSTVNQIGVEAGIRPTASSTLLEVATTAVLGVLGRVAAEHGFSATNFVYWLHAQKGAVGAAMLPWLEAGTAVGAPPEHRLARQPGQAVQQIAPVPAPGWGNPEAEPTTNADGPVALRWQWGALLLLAVCLGYFFGHGWFSPSSRPAEPYPDAATSAAPVTAPATATAGFATAAEPEVVPAPEQLAPEPAPALVPTVPAARALPKARPIVPLGAPRLRRERPASRSTEAGGRYDQDRDTYIYDTGTPIVLRLADGTTQKVGANSTENRLYTFLASPAIQVDSVNRTKGWINFDRINFETGKAMLTPESALQLGNIASILATFPQAVVKIGGYTDSTGDALANFQLSEDRARAAMRTLISMGVSADRLQAKGYGPKYFVKPNNTPTGRALNRRVSIRVLNK